MAHDLVIRGGTLIDGTGSPARTTDVAVDGGLIAEVGRVGPGDQEIDADGLIVTPGFIDPHTHYDGQATWDPLLTPSCWHGVTTAVLGNCGVGFAPVRRDRHEFLVQLMEGVEDIPGTALYEGIRWEWETFPEYLDTLGRMPRGIDIAAQLPHGAVRSYVMDERGADNEAPTADDLGQMAGIVAEAMAAGAVGFSTNRLAGHAAKDGRPVPGTYADEDELAAIGAAMAGAGGGVVEIVSSEAMGMSPGGYRADVEWASRFSRRFGLPVSLCLTQIDNIPELWRDVLGWIVDARAAGADVSAQVAGRPLGILLGLTTKHVFEGRVAYEEVAHLRLEERVRCLAEPERRRRILAESDTRVGVARYALRMAGKAFPLGDEPDYEPPADSSVAAIAARDGRSVEEVYYDLLLEREGRNLVLFALGGYAHHDLDHIHAMVSHPDTIVGLADGGAHCGLICDASVYTSMMSYWVRHRTRGPRLPVELVVAKMTSGPAALYDLRDRGVVAAGMKADLNVIDQERLGLRPPEVVYDLPAGSRRVIQRADGYVATIVSGAVTLSEGTHTGARPGRLVRRHR
jgi:N-acyl-D-aspartate/D-glutamate deacylase